MLILCGVCTRCKSVFAIVGGGSELKSLRRRFADARCQNCGCAFRRRGKPVRLDSDPKVRLVQVQAVSS